MYLCVRFVIGAEFVAFFNGNIVQNNSATASCPGIALEIELPMNSHTASRLVNIERAPSTIHSLLGEHNLIAANVLREWPIGIYSKIHSSDERTVFLPFISDAQ